MTLYNILGIIGVILILSTYALLQAERIDPRSARYSAANASGAALILVSLYFDFNLSAALIEGAWLVISLLGLIKAFRTKRTRL